MKFSMWYNRERVFHLTKTVKKSKKIKVSSFSLIFSIQRHYLTNKKKDVHHHHHRRYSLSDSKSLSHFLHPRPSESTRDSSRSHHRQQPHFAHRWCKQHQQQHKTDPHRRRRGYQRKHKRRKIRNDEAHPQLHHQRTSPLRFLRSRSIRNESFHRFPSHETYK